MQNIAENVDISDVYGHVWTDLEGKLVPLAGIEPALLAETDFESVASTNSATGASGSPKCGSASMGAWQGQRGRINRVIKQRPVDQSRTLRQSRLWIDEEGKHPVGNMDKR